QTHSSYIFSIGLYRASPCRPLVIIASAQRVVEDAPTRCDWVCDSNLARFPRRTKPRAEPSWYVKRRRPMSTERNKTIVRRYWEEVWNQGNFAVMDELLASDFDRHPTPSDADFGHGPAGQKQLVGMYRTAFPDMHQWFDHTEEQRLWHLTFTFGRWLTASWSN